MLPIVTNAGEVPTRFCPMAVDGKTLVFRGARLERGVTAITAPFGNCSEVSDVEVTGDRLIMSQPTTAERAAVTFSYGRDLLTHGTR